MKHTLVDLSPKNKEKVYKEYGMTKQGIQQDVQSIKNWLLKQPHLPRIHGELLNVQVDEWLENYLILCKNSVERAKENLDMYFTSKILVPEVFTHRDPMHQSFKTSFKVMRLGALPKMTDDNHRVIIFSHVRDDANDFDPLYVLKRISMLGDIMLLEGIEHLGLEVIVDCKNICFGQLTKYDICLTKKCADIGFKALPQRVRRIHMVNPTAILDASLTLFKPLLPRKLSDRFVVHRDLKGLQACLGLECVPRDLGGDGPSLDEVNSFWEKKFLAYRDWFLDNDSIKTDESKRIGKCRYETNDCTFGNQGSFRKIEVD
ncbi:retinol-binding protein pinta-like [Rhodnius prolixus]|uniref:retinol-binding protein pinta-like n=1 Tax=Rhodnius prolixus TaxID=13249 RepID=UPI003D18B4CC